MEGKGPKGRKGLNRERTNQAEETNANLNDVAYMASRHISNSKDLWYLDSGTTSHICNNHNVYSEFTKTEPMPIRGIGSSTISTRYGMIKIKFWIKDKSIIHKIQNVLFLPNVLNNLISVSWFDEKGERAIFHKGSVS